MASQLGKMLDKIDLPYALLRGRFMRAVASMEHRGIPLDAELLGRLREHWPSIQEQLIRRVDPNSEVYDGRTFKAEMGSLFAATKDSLAEIAEWFVGIGR